MTTRNTPSTTPELFITAENYKGRDTNVSLCNMTENMHPDPEINPLFFRDHLTLVLAHRLAEHISEDDFDIHDIAEVLACGAEQRLRDINLIAFRNTETLEDEI